MDNVGQVLLSENSNADDKLGNSEGWDFTVIKKNSNMK